MYIEPSLCYNG